MTLPTPLQLPPPNLADDAVALRALPDAETWPVSRQIGVRQRLDVCRSPAFGSFVEGIDVSWHRDVPLHGYLPAVGDLVQLWPDGPWWPVRQRRFDVDGIAEVDLVALRVDPDCDASEAIRRRPEVEWGWWSPSPDPATLLPDGRWRPGHT